ncbi:hypothetical protein H0H87_011050 [Tephrocybe sp. NHM501043]|nr:hypothetical protein H0H87_011050 [Tephrocybe sp. NHM501043]
MAELLPPPIYSQTDPDEGSATLWAEPDTAGGPQILIIPSGDAVNFQKGYLGAEGERAAIEGELQIKATGPDHWARVTISLRTVEKAEDPEIEIELAAAEIVLYTRTLGTRTPFPTSFPFAIPLQADAPQSIQTSNSSLSYFLTASLHPFDPLLPPHSKTLTVHTRRYSSHSHTVPINPETHNLEEPTDIEVQIPRTTFLAGETIPMYVTIPPPPKDLVVDRGLRLRNVRVELVRQVKVESDDVSTPSRSQGNPVTLYEGPSSASSDERLFTTTSSKAPLSPSPSNSSHRTTIARSGASCRFHSSRPVKLRFLLHYPLSTGSPLSLQGDLPSGEHGHYESDEECPSITQLTILHSISFCLFIHVSFVDIGTRRERISTLPIPITILAPPAPLPQVSSDVDVAYSKKHDKPPLRTVRHDDIEHPIPHYSEGEAGPSMLPNSAPPPFEERDAPPPFSMDDGGGPSSSRLPTFLESEEEIIVTSQGSQPLDHPSALPTIAGEGSEFGFLPSDQFDGHPEPMERSITPPPTLEMATMDTDLTDLADIREPQMAMEALGLALDRHEESAAGERPPPPPPARDDPSDPPPSIDSDFRSPELPRQTSPGPPPSLPASGQPPTFTPDELHVPTALPERVQTRAHGHAPPPYLVPINTNEQENTARPPPYMD